MFSLASFSIIFTFKTIIYICSHKLCVLILHVYLLFVSVYLCIIFIWEMKQDVGEGCNFEVATFDYIYPLFKKTYLKNDSKMCSTKYDFNIPYLQCPKPLIII